MSTYIHNKSTANVSLINGKIVLKVGDKQQIAAKDAEHEEVIHALRAGWISLEGEVSTTDTPTPSAGITFKEDEMKGSLTIPGKEPVVQTEPAVDAEPKVTKAKASTKAQ